jgi:PAS domain S-box-containing protein
MDISETEEKRGKSESEHFLAEIEAELAGQKLAVEALRESESEWRLLAKNIGDLIIRVARDGTILEINRTGIEGMNADDVPGKSVYDFVLPEHHEVMREALEKVFRTGKPDTYQLVGTGPDGPHSTWYETRVIPSGLGKQLQYVTMISANIGERRQAERTARMSARVLDATRDRVSIIGPDYVFKYANRAFAEAFEIPADQIPGKHIAELFGREMFENIAKGHLDRCAAGESFDYEGWVSSEGLGRRYQDVSFFPLPSEKGDFNNVVVVDRDLTERRILEEQLQQSEKMRIFGRLASGIAHDFNNLLGAVISFGEILKRRLSSDEELVEYTDAIIASCSQAAQVTRKLLVFSRKSERASLPVGIHEVIDDVALILRHSVDDRIAIRKQLRAERSLIMGDRAMIQSAFLNVAINARDAMPDGGELTFSSRLVTIKEGCGEILVHGIRPGRYIQISVTDTGAGMDEEVQKQIFEPFFTTKNGGEGTGIGLATVYETLKKHGGFTIVDSAPGQGTEFKMFLPLAKSAWVQPA